MPDTKILASTIHCTLPVRNGEGRIFHMENRPTHGIAISTTGSYMYRQNEKNIRADRNHVILLPRGSTYTLYCCEADFAYVVNFDGTVIGAVDDTVNATELRTFPVDPSRVEALCRGAAGMSHAYLQGNDEPYRSLSAFYALLSLLFAPPDPSQFLLPDDPLFHAVRYLDQHFTDPGLRIEILSARAGASVSWFRKRFTAVFGTSPCAYLMNLRLSHAKTLLAADELSIGAVAAACGYSDVYAFSAAFKKYTGISPSAYRKQIRAM